MRASTSCAETISAFASAACAVSLAASALASASASALPRFIQKVTMATREPLAAISAPQVSTSCIASPPIGAPEDACHLLDRAPAEIGGDDDAGPGADVTGDRVSRAQAKNLVVDDDLPDVDHHWKRRERADHRGPPAPLLRDDDRGGLRAGGNLAFDFLDGKIDGELVLRIGGGKLRLVGLDNGVEHRSR